MENRSKNCIVPTKGYFFVKCVKFITGKDCKEHYLEFNRNEKRRSNIMTKARIQPFCRSNNINLGYFDGIRFFPRSDTDRDNALFLYNNHICLRWKSEGVSFNQAPKDLKDNFKIVDNYITKENVNSHFKYEVIPKKIESHLTNFIVYDPETHNTDRAGPYCISFHRLKKLAGSYNRDLSQYELEKCKKDTLVFDGENCVSNALDFVFKIRRRRKKNFLYY